MQHILTGKVITRNMSDHKRIRSLDDEDEITGLDTDGDDVRAVKRSRIELGSCPELSDLTIEACGTSFLVHRVLLANQSEYFRIIFQSLDPLVKTYKVPDQLHFRTNQVAEDFFETIYDNSSKKFETTDRAGTERHFNLLEALDSTGCANLTEQHKKTIKIYGDNNLNWMGPKKLIENTNRFNMPWMIRKRAMFLMSEPRKFPVEFDDGLARACAPIWNEEILSLRKNLSTVRDKLLRISRIVSSFKDTLTDPENNCTKGINGRACHCESDDESHELDDSLDDHDADAYDGDAFESLSEIAKIV